jgi:actin related protein 2/3 complex subunit 2
MPGMILLEPGNRILEEAVGSQILAEKREPLDVRLCDFDDVAYRVQVEKDNLDLLKVSFSSYCYSAIEDKGGKAALEANFGKYVASPETGFDLTLAIPIPEVEDKDAMVKSLSLVKSKIIGGVFDHHFQALLDGKTSENFKFDLRSDTTVYFCPRDDRVTVIFSVDFMENVDKVIAKVFLQEFVDARKKIGRAPPCAWGANPPNELADFGVKENQGNLGYISFAVMKSHLDKGKKESVINVLQSFRTFLQYHIKSSKSHFHSKMRNRVRELIKVLNRAKVEDEKKEKKLASGKTFKRG